MAPTAVVSGLYFIHPDSRYFEIGKINEKEVEEYAKRKEMVKAEVEKWLGPNLSY